MTIPALIPSNAVEINNGRPVTTSLAVAQVFEKRHDHVLRDIADIRQDLANADLAFPNFGESSYIDSQNVSRPMVEMDKDGFTLLVMGYTGAKAMQFKVAYIQRFNEMEAALRQGGQSPLPPSPVGYRRVLLVLRDNGTFEAKQVPDSAVMFAPEDLPQILADSTSGVFARSLLPAIIGAAAERLARLPAPKPSQYPAPAKPQRPQPINPLSDALSKQIAAFLADRQTTTTAELIEALGLPKTRASEISAGASLRRSGWFPRQQTWNGVRGVRVYQKLGGWKL